MIKFAFYSCRFGVLKIGYNNNSIVYIGLTEGAQNDNAPNQLSDNAFAQIEEYLSGTRKAFDLPIELTGTDFQKRVWNELKAIPYAQTRTYKEIAQAIGNPDASRAVGSANHNNPLLIVIPCHRVIGANNKLTGYAYGVEMKKALLDLEKSAADNK